MNNFDPVIDQRALAAETDRQAAVKAVRQAEDRERLEMRRWLVAYGRILWQPPIRTSSESQEWDAVSTGWISGSSGRTLDGDQ